MTEHVWTIPPAKKPELLNPLVLAYVGDAVFDLYVRQYLVSLPQQKPHHLHKTASRIVSAKAQSRALEALLPDLTEAEIDVVKRGRNAKSGSVPKNADLLEYRRATGLECLIGYLHYQGEHERVRALVDAAIQYCLGPKTQEGT